MQFNQESLDKATQALAIFRTITDDIELFYRRSGTIGEHSIFSSICTTYVKLISNKLFKEKIDNLALSLDGGWKDGISGAITKFKIFQIEKWMSGEGYSREDRSLLGPILLRIMKSDFQEIIHPEVAEIPPFAELSLRSKISVMEKFGEYCEAKGFLFTHENYHIARDDHKLVTFLGPSTLPVGVQAGGLIWRIKMLHGDRALYICFVRGMLTGPEFVAMNMVAQNLPTTYDFEVGRGLQPEVIPTTLTEVFSAIGKSEFKKSLWSLFSVLKLSSVAGYLCDLVSPSGALKTVVSMLDEIFKITGALHSIQDIFYRLFTEILPAIWYGDASLIKPELFSARMDIIYKAIVAAKSHNREVMTEVIHEWGAHPNTHIVELELQFHEVLVLMTKFVSSSTTTHLTSVMRSVISDLVIVEQQIANYIKLGQTRYEPFSIGLRGEAGIGKSTLITEIQANIGTILDLPCHTTQEGEVVYDAPAVITEGVKFDENIYNTTKTIVFDDMNLVAAEFQEKGSGNLSVKFLQCQGSVPFSLNKANIEEKKGSFWNNNLTVVTSNLTNYGLDARVLDQGAWSRRIHVDIEMTYMNMPDRPGEKDRNYVTYSMSFLNYETSMRHNITTHDKLDMFRHLRAHAQFYWDRRQRRRERLPVCAACRELPHNCQCALQPQDPNQIHAHAALWMGEEEIARASLIEIIKTMITEEAVCYVVLLLLLNIVQNPLVVMLLIGTFREIVEWWYKKPFDFFRFLVITVSLPYFPLSIMSHLLVNYNLILHKLKTDQDFVAPFLAEIPIFIEDSIRQSARIAASAAKNEFTPNWWLQWRISKMNPLQYRKQIEKKHAMYFCGFLGAGFLIKSLYDMTKTDYTQTAFGQPASETDKNATRTLDAQIGGQPEPRQDGLATTNDWKRPMKILYQPGGITPHGANVKCVFNVKITNGKIENTCKGFLSSEGFVTVKHALPETPSDIMFWHESTPLEKIHMSYEPSSPSYKHFNDLIIIPYSDSRKKLSIIRDHEPKLTDRYMVNGIECGIVGVATNLREYPYLMLLDIPGGKGLSGSMVTLIQREGAPVANVIVGAVVAVLAKGPLTGKACAELFLTPALMHKYREMPKTIRTSNEIETTINPGDIEQTASSTSSLEQTNIWLSEEYDVLQPYLTPEIVRHTFLRVYDVKVSEQVAPHSVLGHLKRDQDGNIKCNIGEFVGSVCKPPAPNKSKFYYTEFYAIASQLGDVSKYTIPKMEKFVENGVYHNSLLACVRQMNSSGHIYDQAPFWSASTLVYDHIRDIIGDDLHDWEPYDLKTVIIGDTFTNAINRDAAKGFPFKGIKDDWVWGDLDEPILSKELVDDIQRMIDNMDNYNIPPLNIASTALKDEIISKKKSDEAMIRVFFGGNTSFLVLCRAYLGKLMNIFVKHRHRLFAKIGMNAIGSELHKMVSDMFKRVMGVELTAELLHIPCWVDGDFSKYDKMLLVLKFAVHVLWLLVKNTNFFRNHPTQLNRVRLILTALQEYIVIIGEDIFIMRDKMPSGVWATALINCICEMIIEVLMFYFLLYVKRGEVLACDFVVRGKYVWNIDVFEVLAIANYGDDNIKCVAQMYWPLYGHENIMKFSQWLHMAMTPARKHETEIKLKPITEILFLKRVFTWNSHLNRLVGALDVDSIAKMLAFSDTKNVEEWRYAVVMTARREIAFHGLALYDRFRNLFKITQTWEETLEEIDRNEWKFVPEVQVPIYEIIFGDLTIS